MNSYNNIDNLVEYATIINNYQHGNYELNNDEVNMIKIMNESDDLKTKIEVDKINKMSFDERKKYIENLNEKNEQQKIVSSSIEDEISLTFGVSVSNIKVSTLQDGKQLYTFFDDNLGRNVVLQDDDNKPLMSKLEEIRKESSKDADMEKKDLLEDERVRNNLEVRFILISELEHHLSQIAKMDDKKRKVLKFLLDHAVEFDIVSIDLENIIGLDSQGNIFEVYVEELSKERKMNNVDNNQIQETNEKMAEFSMEESEVQKDEQLSQMLADNAQIQQQKTQELNQESQKLSNSNRVLQIENPE